MFWHKNLRVVPRFTAADLETFISGKSVVPVTSTRGYKFFIEKYIFDYEGEYNNYLKAKSGLMPSPDWTGNKRTSINQLSLIVPEGRFIYLFSYFRSLDLE